ncbi:MAG: pyruvate kinase [Eubacteriales bacterium]
MDSRRTKIVCTLGPAVSTEEAMENLIKAGMNGARFNFSHGDHEEQLDRLTKLKKVRDRLGIPVAALLDTKGPEIRIKKFKEAPITLARGDKFALTVADVEGDQNMVAVTYTNLHQEVKKGNHILVDDGLIDLLVESVDGDKINCVVENGGQVSNNKSLNLPGISIKLPALTEKDKADLKFAAENDFDYVAASFVRKGSDVDDIRKELAAHGGESVRIISKIENQEGVDNLEEILEKSDGLMVARGDLGVEIPAEDVPAIQKRMIRLCSCAGKVVITATQMLDSMMRNPRPTRAEVSDVANAVHDGTSCVMLSGETANGQYPVETVQTMANIVKKAEASIDYWDRFTKTTFSVTAKDYSSAICHSCCSTAKVLEAKAIICCTHSGSTARDIARFLPSCTVAAFTTNEKARRQLALVWGIKPYLYGVVDTTDRLLHAGVDCAMKEGIVEVGDMVVITAGVPIGQSVTTNLIKAELIQEKGI